ncbi:hypothetical protein WN51_06684 [Melipona quadrifasciata]|uniref:Uncharacterized protein n=1 Tax=Melipona quadrifasciata TaxID=166423 RepID=A0A0M9AA75_9HYME|nr:hypothetical protein WN51_06684 [Melipona quadrifasciata]
MLKISKLVHVMDRYRKGEDRKGETNVKSSKDPQRNKLKGMKDEKDAFCLGVTVATPYLRRFKFDESVEQETRKRGCFVILSVECERNYTCI